MVEDMHSGLCISAAHLLRFLIKPSTSKSKTELEKDDHIEKPLRRTCELPKLVHEEATDLDVNVLFYDFSKMFGKMYELYFNNKEHV